MLRWSGYICVLSLGLAVAGDACAQKNPGNTIPTAPVTPYAAPVSPYAAPVSPYAAPYTAPARPQVTSPAEPASPPAAQGGDAAAERVARSLPLDPSIRELRDRLPPNIPAVERSLGLRPPRGPATDLRGRTPSSREIVNALAPR